MLSWIFIIFPLIEIGYVMWRYKSEFFIFYEIPSIYPVFIHLLRETVLFPSFPSYIWNSYSHFRIVLSFLGYSELHCYLNDRIMFLILLSVSENHSFSLVRILSRTCLFKSSLSQVNSFSRIDISCFAGRTVLIEETAIRLSHIFMNLFFSITSSISFSLLESK